MGITTIKRIENRSRSAVKILHRDVNTKPRGVNILIEPGGNIAADIWIPWAPTANDFSLQHLQIVEAGITKYWIWQANNADGDFIRYSMDGQWHDQGDKVYGYPDVAKNIFEAVGGAIGDAALQPLADLVLGERALVVLDSHFETIPIAPKPLLPPFTVVKRIENLSSKTVTLFNKSNTTSSPTIAPSQSADVDMMIPMAGQATDFGSNRLELRLDGQTRYWIWQAASDFDGDYIRFATTAVWSPVANRVKGIDVTGITPADLVFTFDRTLIVRDSGFELWPRPLFIDGLLDTFKSLIQTASRVREEPPLQLAPSVPRKSAVSFNVAGHASDAYNSKQPRARHLYNDSGKRYEFTIDPAGTIIATDASGNPPPVIKGWSYTVSRIGNEVSPLPPFDLIAASGGRLFAKVRGTNQFFLGTMDHMFIVAPKGAADDAPETHIPGTYLKLDPQFGMRRPTRDLLASTKDVPTAYPMSERFPLFHRIMEREIMDMMLARMNPQVLYELDFRPPQNVIGLAIRDVLGKFGPIAIVAIGKALGIGFLAVIAPLIIFEIFKGAISDALLQDAELGSAPPDGMPTYRPITYARLDSTVVKPPAIKYVQVIDIGVSHIHWFEQYNLAGGGEIQPMIHSEFGKNLYRFFNGPVQDGDGFIDGTCNVYILVRHEPTEKRPYGFALLFQDEQAFFSQRWRMVDPDDGAGLSSGLIPYLGNPEYSWNKDTYWCPFRNGHINKRSRLAVAAHVLLVTGRDRVSKVPRIYSINFSWATMDRTWRHRNLPRGTVTPAEPADEKDFDETTIDVDIEKLQTDMERVYPETIRLREDLTIHIKGVRRVGENLMAGRYYQRYLPADNGLVPPSNRLTIGGMPSPGYSHPWKFLPEKTFRLADNFSHFGIHDVVDARCQYYDVTPSSAGDAATLDAGGPGPWIDDIGQLFVSQWKFRYDIQRPGIDPVDPPSLFNPDTRLRIVRRGSRWIAMLWDKRDDDLVPFERVPMTVTLKKGSQTVRVTIGPRHQVWEIPMVRTAHFWIEPDGRVGIGFASIGTTWEDVRSNVWRVRMSALEAFEDPATHLTRARVLPLFDSITEAFTPIGGRWYERRWLPSAAELAALRRFCSLEGEMDFATSIYFEDIVGHVSVPESIAWQRSNSISADATPRSIPLDRPVEVIVTARDGRTQNPLEGNVLVDDEIIAKIGQKFTHTFKLVLPMRTGLISDTKGGPIELPDPVPPIVKVQVPDYPDAVIDVEFFTIFSAASFVRMSVPSVMVPGNRYATSVTMRNNGTSTWTSEGPNPFRLGSVGDSFTWGFNRRELPGPVVPGAEVTFAFDVIAPGPGIHHFQWRMLQELIGWFGAPTTDFLVQVPAPPPPTLTISVTPLPPPLNVVVSVVVRAVDSQTGALIAGRVKINDIDVAATNTPFNFTFRTRRIGVKPDIQIIYPTGSVTAPGYEPTMIEFGFPEL